MSTQSTSQKLVVAPMTQKRFADLEAIMNARGCAQARSCWCMAYRRTGAFTPARGQKRQDANRADFKALVDAGLPTGVIAYRGKTPLGWLSISPRAHFLRLERSSVMKPVDQKPVWSIICLVVAPAHRGQGVAKALLQGAIAYARRKGATLIEAYPVDRARRSRDDDLWFGPKSLYDKAGFKEVARRKPQRPIMRRKTN
jgi:ribosomal protein S18 acetylase RimI-like enzyme